MFCAFAVAPNAMRANPQMTIAALLSRRNVRLLAEGNRHFLLGENSILSPEPEQLFGHLGGGHEPCEGGSLPQFDTDDCTTSECAEGGASEDGKYSPDDSLNLNHCCSLWNCYPVYSKRTVECTEKREHLYRHGTCCPRKNFDRRPAGGGVAVANEDSANRSHRRKSNCCKVRRCSYN